MSVVKVWTDGSCIPNPGAGGWAFYMSGELVSGHAAHATNNQMEMQAMLEAVTVCPADVTLHFISDSSLALGFVVTNWGGENSALQELRDRIHRIARFKRLRLTGELVKGHGTCNENRMVDGTAKQEAKLERSRQLSAKG